MRNQWVIFIRVVFADFFTNNCPYIAAGIAYWSLFSMFPLSLAFVSVLGFINSTTLEQQEMASRIVANIPVSSDYLTDLLSSVAEARGALSVIAVLGLLLSSLAVFSAVRKGVNHAWHVTRPHPFFVGRGIDVLMFIAVGVLILLQATNLTGVIVRTAAQVLFLEGVLVSIGFELLQFGISLGAFAVLYRLVPNTEVAWRDVWLGSTVGAVLVSLVRFAFSGFLVNVSEFNLVYGSLGALMALLVWVYLSALALVLGATVSYVYSRAFGSRKTITSLTALMSRYGLNQSLTGSRAVAGLVGNWVLTTRRPRRWRAGRGRPKPDAP